MSTDRALRVTAVVYALAIAVHFADHLRRGVDASPRGVVTLGVFAALVQALVIAAALAGHRAAPLLAVAIGVGDGLGVFLVHLLPRWSALSDSFPDGAPGVTAFSWATGIAEIVAGLAFAYAGWRVLRASRLPVAP